MFQSQQDLTLLSLEDASNEEEKKKPVRPPRRSRSPDKRHDHGKSQWTPNLNLSHGEEKATAADEIFRKFGIQFGTEHDSGSDKSVPVSPAVTPAVSPPISPSLSPSISPSKESTKLLEVCTSPTSQNDVAVILEESNNRKSKSWSSRNGSCSPESTDAQVALIDALADEIEESDRGQVSSLLTL